MDNLVSLITNVGFPCAITLILLIFLREETASHKEETNSLKDAITKLELAITTLINKLEG